MDDDRLVEHLRTIDRPSEPDRRFVDRLYDQLAAELELARDTHAPTIAQEPGSRATRSRRVAWLVAAAALVILVVGSVVVGGSFLARQHRTSTLLEAVRASGTLRIAVRPDTPQVPPPGAFGGFDYDVALELADRLGLRAEVTEIPATDMLGRGSAAGWDVGMPSAVLPSGQGRFASTTAYYHWPIYVLVPATSAARSVSDLQGVTVCVVAGTVGESWLTGSLTDVAGIEAVIAPPSGALPRSLTDEQACLDDMNRGRSAALVTTSLLAADLATRPNVSVLTGRPVLSEGRAIIADRTGLDSDTLLQEIQRALDSMHDDGTLTLLSARRFGGEDLTIAPIR